MGANRGRGEKGTGPGSGFPRMSPQYEIAVVVILLAPLFLSFSLSFSLASFSHWSQFAAASRRFVKCSLSRNRCVSGEEGLRGRKAEREIGNVFHYTCGCDGAGFVSVCGGGGEAKERGDKRDMR